MSDSSSLESKHTGQTKGQHFKLLEGKHVEFIFSLTNCPDFLAQRKDIDKYYEHVYPLVIRMVVTLLTQESQIKLGSGASTLYTYVDLLLIDDAAKNLQAIVKRQKREIRGQAYDLIDVFNFNNSSSEENMCLICLCTEPDCIIMPCRHMVVNIDCAKMIDEKKDKFECPLCRCEAEELIYVSAAMGSSAPTEKAERKTGPLESNMTAVKMQDIAISTPESQS